MTRKRRRYTGVRPGKKTGSWIINYYDHAGARHCKAFKGTEAEAAKACRMLLAQQDRIKAGLEAPPTAKPEVSTLHQLWEVFKADQSLKVKSGSMSAKSLERSEHSYKALLGYDPALASQQLDRIKSADFEAFEI